MNHLVDDYIKTVLVHVKYKKVHSSLARELYDHIECIREDMQTDEVGEDHVYLKAIQQMGDPIQLGKDLHRLHKPRMDWFVLLSIGIITFFGFLQMKLTGNDTFVLKHMISLAIGIIGFILLYFLDYRKLQKYSFVLPFVSIIFLLFVEIYGVTINGARRWLFIGPFSAMIVSITIPLVLIGYSGILAYVGHKKKHIIILSILTTVASVVLTLRNYLTEGIILLATLYFMTLYFLKIHEKQHNYKKLRWILLFGGIATLIESFAFVLFEGYRIVAFDWNQNPETLKIVQNIRILSNASWFGNSGIQSLDQTQLNPMTYIAQEYSFISIIGNIGIFSAIIVGIVLCGLIVRSFLLAHMQKNLYGNCMMIGISILFSLQVCIGILAQLNYLPVSKLCIPFLSYDGTTIIFETALLGLFLGIHRQKDIMIDTLLV